MSDEQVNHPAHYGGADNPYEVIKVIEEWDLGFKGGNALKYILRTGKKPGADVAVDLRKALWYLRRLAAAYEVLGKFEAECFERGVVWDRDPVICGMERGNGFGRIGHAEVSRAYKLPGAQDEEGYVPRATELALVVQLIWEGHWQDAADTLEWYITQKLGAVT